MAKRKRYNDYMLLAPGEQVQGQSGTYLVDQVVGTGAFGAVYSAVDPNVPNRHIALKEFFPAKNPRDQKAQRDLFDRERYVGAEASPHPLMPSFYEAFTTDGYYYIAQEFIEGSTLDDIIFKRHPMPVEWTLKWAASLADALAFLHSREIVHHDLKPANIRITPQGHLALLDFGAAQYFGKGRDKTKPVDVYGTEGYLPPELDTNGEWVADVRTDIFALGCIIYEMIAGESPDQDQINARSLYVTNSLMNRPNADLGLVKLINNSLSYNTEYRYASANQFLLDLRKIAPPVLLVNKKNLRFGNVMSAQNIEPLTVTLYNAGGGKLRGEIKPRAPWITVSRTTFSENLVEVKVGIDTSKITEYDQILTGRLEINSADEMDDNGAVLRSGDRWFVDVAVSVTLSPGKVALFERDTDDKPPILVLGKEKQAATGDFAVKNIGGKPIEVKIATESAIGGSGTAKPLTISPTTATLAPAQTLTVEINAPSSDPLRTTITVQTSEGQSLSVPIVVKVGERVKKAPPVPEEPEEPAIPKIPTSVLIQNFVTDHKWPIIGVIVVLLGIIFFANIKTILLKIQTTLKPPSTVPQLKNDVPGIKPPHAANQGNNNGPQIAGTILKGVPIGFGPPAAGTSDGFKNAFDGNTNTFFNSMYPSGSFTGITLNSPMRVTAIRYFPRSGSEGQMNGGRFEGSSPGQPGFRRIAVIQGVPSPGWNRINITGNHKYDHLRYFGPAESSCAVAEIEFYGEP